MAAAASLCILWALLFRAAAFQATSQSSRLKHRKGGIIWNHHGQENNVDESSSVPTVQTPESVVIQCMDAMQQNDVPWLNHGLEICFDFSSDRCRAALGGSLDEFISYASNPTFGSMTNAKSYEIVNVGPIIAGTPTRGSLQTVLVKVTQEKWEDKHFLW